VGAALQPRTAAACVGNRHPVKHLLQWLEVWAGKRRAPKKKKNGKASRPRSRSRWYEDYDECDHPDSLGPGNVMVLRGPSGSGKTAAVHACAAQLGFTVIEMNASTLRSSAVVRKLCAEAAQSHGLGLGMGLGMGTGMLSQSSVGSGGSSNATADLNLILFDEVGTGCYL
jgi:DNA polymerase III delta prime subunit